MNNDFQATPNKLSELLRCVSEHEEKTKKTVKAVRIPRSWAIDLCKLKGDLLKYEYSEICFIGGHEALDGKIIKREGAPPITMVVPSLDQDVTELEFIY